MNEETVNVIDNLISAVSILNKTDEHLDGLDNSLSECDILKSDYEHFIEITPIEEVDLNKLYVDMQKNFKKRRTVKNDIILRDNYNNLRMRLNNCDNRQLLIQHMKNAVTKLNANYKNRILSLEEINQLKKTTEIKRGRGRPKKTEGLL